MPSYYEFFAGGGMARAGLGPDWSCVFANDIDEKKGAAYKANWGAEHLKIADVASLTTGTLPGRADLAWASFPCQDLSLAGAGAGLEGYRSGTFWPFWKLVCDLNGKVDRALMAIGCRNPGQSLTIPKANDVAYAHEFWEPGR
ncbi:MAG: DNA cytosine methyltransferase [Acidobacteriaceae bacterium]